MGINNADWHRKAAQLLNQTLRGTNQSSGRSSVGNRGIDKGVIAGGLTGGGIGPDAINTDQIGNIHTSSHLNVQHSVLPLVSDVTVKITANNSNNTVDIEIYGVGGTGTEVSVYRPDQSILLCPPVLTTTQQHNFTTPHSVYCLVYYDVFHDNLGNGKFVAVWKTSAFTAIELATAYQDNRIPILATPTSTNTGLTSGTTGTYTQVLAGPGSFNVPSGGGGGLSSLAGLTGPALTLGSSDSSVTITPAGTNIDLKASGGGGSTVPVVVQAKFNGTAVSSITLDQAPITGHSLLLFLDMYNTGTATAVSSTNTTWTKLKTFTSGGGAIYDLWVGIVSGTGGTVISITHLNSFCSCTVIEITSSLTPTLGANSTSSTTNGIYKLSGATSGNLVAICAGTDNTTNSMTNLPVNISSAAGVASDIVTLMVLFATANPVYTSLSTTAGGLIIAEIT